MFINSISIVLTGIAVISLAIMTIKQGREIKKIKECSILKCSNYVQALECSPNPLRSEIKKCSTSFHHAKSGHF